MMHCSLFPPKISLHVATSLKPEARHLCPPAGLENCTSFPRPSGMFHGSAHMIPES